MSGRPITWIHKDGPLLSGRIHSHSFDLETIQLRPFHFEYLATRCSWASRQTLTASLDFLCRTQPERREFGIWAPVTVYGNVRYLVSHFVGPYEIEIKG